MITAEELTARFGDVDAKDIERVRRLKLLVPLGDGRFEIPSPALMGAAGRGANEVVQFLVDHGAKLDVKVRGGMTAVDMALGRRTGSNSTVNSYPAVVVNVAVTLSPWCVLPARVENVWGMPLCVTVKLTLVSGQLGIR